MMKHPFDCGANLVHPAVELVIGGKVCQWQEQPDGTFVCGDMSMRVSYSKIRNGFRKNVEISASCDMPTPDYLVIDRQQIPDGALKMRGYVASAGTITMESSDEEGGGLMPGCGYPLIGEKYFVALEHQAGFNIVREKDETSAVYELRQHPVWQDGKLVTMSEVFVKADDPEKEFRKYLDGIRKKSDGKMLFSFCSFWSEPYCGNYEYVISNDNYRTFVTAFNELGLYPDVYTIDAGWQDRNSIFMAKAAAGGEAGVVELREFLNKKDVGLSLWVSHNGPMGISPEYLKSIGVAVGSGFSSTYRGNNFGVLLDEKLETMLRERFCQLVTPPIGAVHLKMDWDNDCATNDDFKVKYPTRNHVREASVNVQNRIATAINQANPAVKIRHGWWPSPWQLQYADHVFLADGGDCEYSSIPSLNQRDCAFTARDIQYYHHFRRDGGMVPLACIDNHDFPQAPRNPFMDDDAVLSNTVLWALMRGTTYQPWKIQPEALTPAQADIIRNMMAYARSNSDILCNGTSSMVGGNPRHGEIYGFMHTRGKERLLALRNPLPVPQEAAALPGVAEGEKAVQVYPCCQGAAANIIFAPHEVKVFHIGSKLKSPEVPFQYADGNYRFPSSVTVSSKIAPRVSQVYQVPEFEITDGMDQLIPGGKRYWFKVRAPYRMKNCALQVRLTGKMAKDTVLKLYIARDARATGNCYRVPYTEIFSGNPGRGENQNPENGSVVSEWGRLFNVPIPCGGNVFCRLEVDNREVGVEVWASGYETPSFNAARRGLKLTGVMQIPPHPYGFPRCAKLEVCGSEPEITE